MFHLRIHELQDRINQYDNTIESLNGSLNESLR
jgi:hypothetical protein